MRLIDADALKRDVCKYCNDVYSDEPCEPSDCEHMRIIDNQPTIDAVEVRHGRWEYCEPDRYGSRKPACSVCGKYSLHMWSDHMRMNYCPNCNAKMDGERKDDDREL